MKITDIIIENLGPYIGKNQISFDLSDPKRKVALVGGKNGAGKTTLFNAIRIGMYGCRAFGFETENTKYLQQITQIINSNSRIEKKGRASVTISILMDDGKDDFVYTFERFWQLSAKSIREEVIVTRNGTALSETEKSDFQSYLLQLIPPDLFKFYFFDGEGIGNFAFNGMNETDFKHAFLKLCGLDTMEIIYDNFQRLSSSKKKFSSQIYEEYSTKKTEVEANYQEIDSAVASKTEIINKLVLIDEQLAKGESDFIERGGITKTEYQAMLQQLSKEENRRESTRKWLKETANEILPFVILKDQMAQLKEQILAEENHQSGEVLLEYFNNAEVRDRLMSVFSLEGISDPVALSNAVLSTLADSINVDNTNTILSLSKKEQLDILARINQVFTFDVSKITDAVKEIDKSLNVVKRIRKKLDKSDASGAQEYLEQKEKLLQEKTDCLKRQIEIEHEIEQLNQKKNNLENEFKRVQEKYEEYLKSQSVNDISARGMLAFRDLQRRLYRKYISEVEARFTESFNNLINKSDLIDGIKINSQLQVLPYKNKAFKRADLVSMFMKNGADNFIDNYGSIAYEAFKSDYSISEEIVLPVEVKQNLSAGEKQIFIMALYQALSSLNNVSVPYIIDTPFARIDTEHRQNILKNFFMKLKGQIIILSTDEEITGEYKDTIDKVVSNYFLLQHSDNNGTTIKNDCYFGGSI